MTIGSGGSLTGINIPIDYLAMNKKFYEGAIDKLNELGQQFANMTGGTFQPYEKKVFNTADEYKQAFNTAFPMVQSMQNTINTYNVTPQPTPTPEPAPPTFADMPGGADIEAELNKLTMNKPEFNPETVTQWQKKLIESNAPLMDEATKRLNEAYAATSPATYGSGRQMSATRQMLENMRTQIGNEAYGIAERDLNRAMDLYQLGLVTKTDLAKFLQNQASTEEWQNKLQNWEQQKMFINRAWANEDYTKQANLARELAKMYQGDQPGFWDYLSQGLGTGAGYLLGGKALTGLTNLFKSPASNPYSYTTLYNPNSKLNLPGYNIP